MGRYAQYRKRGRADAGASACPEIGSPTISAVLELDVVHWESDVPGIAPGDYKLQVSQGLLVGGPFTVISTTQVSDGNTGGDAAGADGLFFIAQVTENNDGSGCAGPIAGPTEAS